MTREQRAAVRYAIDEAARRRVNEEAARAGRPGRPIATKPKRSK